jgi:hypothetical protein
LRAILIPITNSEMAGVEETKSIMLKHALDLSKAKGGEIVS